MKKVVSTLIILAVAVTMSFAAAKKADPKMAECKKACETTYKQCEKDAMKDKAKKAACHTAKKDCMKNCMSMKGMDMGTK